MPVLQSPVTDRVAEPVLFCPHPFELQSPGLITPLAHTGEGPHSVDSVARGGASFLGTRDIDIGGGCYP